MPLVYQQNINEATRLAVWHIAEPEDFFLQKTILPNAITHPHKRLQHLAGRLLLTELFENFPLKLIQIADTKKPFLADEAFHFSISHSGDYAAAIVSKKNRVGVDIQTVTEKIELIKDRFLSAEEQQILNAVSKLRFADSETRTPNQLLTLAWSIKETMFKWYGDGGIDFKKHMHIKNISTRNNEIISQCILAKNKQVQLSLHSLLFNNNSLTWLVT